MTAATPVPTPPSTGLEDVVRAARALARSTRDLGMDTAELAERELAMAIRIAADLRDQITTREALDEARKHPLGSRLRKDAHDVVDIVMDTVTVAALTATRAFERVLDDPRPQLATRSGGQTPSSVVLAGT